MLPFCESICAGAVQYVNTFLLRYLVTSYLYSGVQGHRSRYQSKAHVWLPIND